jgi:hypothetical protein
MSRMPVMKIGSDTPSSEMFIISRLDQRRG